MGRSTNRDVVSVEELAVTAQGPLGELAASALPVLQTKNRGKALEVHLKRRLLGRLLRASRGNFRIVPGRQAWRLGAKAIDLGIAEDGVLGGSSRSDCPGAWLRWRGVDLTD